MGAPFDRLVTSIPIDGSEAARRVSAFRAQHGLGPVSVDSRLMAAADAQALAMGERDRVSHDVAGSLPRRLGVQSYDWAATAENIGAGYSTLAGVIESWKDSPGHRKNLLNPYVTEIGIAAAAAIGAQYDTYWALVLASPRGPATAGPQG